jgi:hypothetical protein
MSKINKIITLLLSSSLVLISCKKDGGQDSSTISSPFTVKYEFTSATAFDLVAPKPIVWYFNSSGGSTQTTANILPWILEQTVTSTNRPFNLQITGLSIFLTSPGSVIGNIYINGVKKATVTAQTRALFGSNVVDQL